MKLLFAYCLLCFSAQFSWGQAPSLVNYQGELKDSNGVALPDGAYEVEFKIWDVPIAGDIGETLIWGHVYDVTLINGRFNVILGSDNSRASLGAATQSIQEAFSSSERYIGITLLKNADGELIENPIEIIPRQQILSVPYALNAINSISAIHGVPVGTVIPFAGNETSIPEGWLLCDGKVYNAVTNEQYEELFSVISNNYGGSDSSDFKVPDLRGRIPLGKDNMGGLSADVIIDSIADQLGAITGSETHAHVVPRTGWGTEGGSFGSGPAGKLVVSSGAHEIVEGLESLTESSIDRATDSKSNLQPSLILNYLIKF